MKATIPSMLLIDGNPSFAKVLLKFVMRSYSEEFSVTVTHSAESAKQFLIHETPAIILMDINLPDINGLQLLPELKRLSPEAKIIVSTLLDTPEYQHAAAELGAHAFIPKNNLYDFLPSALNRLHPNRSLLAI